MDGRRWRPLAFMELAMCDLSVCGIGGDDSNRLFVISKYYLFWTITMKRYKRKLRLGNDFSN
jgi:hypothetical protein